MLPTVKITLARSSWITYSQPFPHTIAPRVFEPSFAKALADQVQGIIRCSRSLRHFGSYDAYGSGLDSTTTGPLGVFISEEWHDLIADIMRIPAATRHVNAGIHHHRPGASHGTVHNDLNPVYFDRDSDGGVVLPAHARVSYTNGTTHSAGACSHKVVRCTTLIYYTANGPWKLGDGGETGLYARSRDKVTNAVKRIPPITNSMLLFNCAPTSLHAFLRNKTERNCVIMWLHAPPETMAERFGESSFVEFARRSMVEPART